MIKNDQLSLIPFVNLNIMHSYILLLNSFGLLICYEIFGFLSLTHLSFYVNFFFDYFHTKLHVQSNPTLSMMRVLTLRNMSKI